MDIDWARTLPILVQFGGGAILCAIGVIGGYKGGYINLELAEDRRSIFIVVAGYFALLLFSCVFTYWLPHL